MEGDRFDALTKRLTTTARSRRQTLAGPALGTGTTRRMLVAGLAALLPVVRGDRPAAAASCNTTTRQCAPSLKCCNGECRRPQASATSLKCSPCPGCSNGRVCVKINKQHGFCQGEAGGPCLPKAGCIGGATCVPNGPGKSICACSGGFTACEGRCVNLHTDPAHCGSCRNQCLLGTTICCAVGALDPGECVDPQSDERHCGGCGRSCGSGETCLGGRCQSQCRAGLTACNGTCVDLQSDPANCGGCGRACSNGVACQGGTCTGVRCANDGEACQADANCCNAPASICRNGVCGSRCRPGFTFCGNCVDLQSDPANCGGCGRACPSGVACQNGACAGGGAGGECVPYGGACQSASNCCAGVPCNGNLCRYN